MADQVRVRRLTDVEGQRLQRIVRRGKGSTVRLRRAMVILASAGGNTVPAIARLVQADEDSVREVIHRFNEMGLASLDPRGAGGRPRRISTEDEEFIIATAAARRRPPAFDAETYRHRNTVERAINKLKNHRAVATRYDKRDYVYRGTIDVASIRIWLRDPVR